MEPVLRVEQLTKIYRKGSFGKTHSEVTAVRDLSFCLMRGECLGLIGESGSGKSTAAKLITRLTDATEGRILLDGEDITGWRGKKLRQAYRKMQMVFQSPADSFDPRRTLGDGIGESLLNSGMRRAQAKEEIKKLLVMCGLSEEFAEKYPHEVSGGQCQRAAIARAIAIRPEVLICDEATSALDVTVQKEIIALLNRLRWEQGANLSILFICHDIALVQQFCDRVIVMYHGQIVEQGTPDEVIRDPKDEYTQRLINSIL